MYNQHTRGMATTRHRSLVERGRRKAFVRDLNKKMSEENRYSWIVRKRFEHIELPAKLLDYLFGSNKSNINQWKWLRCTSFCQQVRMQLWSFSFLFSWKFDAWFDFSFPESRSGRHSVAISGRGLETFLGCVCVCVCLCMWRKYSSIQGNRNWHIETADWNLDVSLDIWVKSKETLCTPRNIA